MKVIFGIGNPGAKYEKTRHNVGFMVIDQLAQLSNIKLRLRKNWLQGNYRLSVSTERLATTDNRQPITDSQDCYLIKPLTFVNECGIVAKQLKEMLDFSLSDFLVVVDDFSLPLGTTRMRAKGSSGSHKGLESIIYHLQSIEFPRLRVGIGQCRGKRPFAPTDFVLSEFTNQELQVLAQVLDRVIHSIRVFVTEGINRAIEVCNAKERNL